MSRKRFSETEVLQTLAYRVGTDAIICCRCYAPLLAWINGVILPLGKIEREHFTEIALGGADAPANCGYSHKSCHDKVTNGTKATSVGSSKQRIAKVKRLRGEIGNRAGKKMPSRPFPKAKTKKAWPKRKLQQQKSRPA